MSIKQTNPKELMRLILIITILGSVSSSIIISTNSATNLAQPTGTITGRVCVGECPYIEPTSTPEPTPEPTSLPQEDATIAYLGDSRPSKFGTLGITELTKDLNQIIPQSPTGKLDAIFMIGDMDHISQTVQAYKESNVNTIPMYFVVGNHEIDNNDMTYLKSLQKPINFTIYPGPIGTEITTFSTDIKNIHVTNLNIYWNELNDDAWFKYGGGDGGYVGTKLMNWLNNDLTNTSNWKIVLVHEPMYPLKRHVGNSLDKDTTNRNNLQTTFINQNVQIFIAAHTHYATINKKDTVYHVDAGISGQKTVDGEDPYASIIYTNSTNNTLTLTWKHENPTWSIPSVETYIINR